MYKYYYAVPITAQKFWKCANNDVPLHIILKIVQWSKYQVLTNI